MVGSSLLVPIQVGEGTVELGFEGFLDIVLTNGKHIFALHGWQDLLDGARTNLYALVDINIVINGLLIIK